MYIDNKKALEDQAKEMKKLYGFDWNLMKEFRNRLDRIIENAEEHIGINSTKKEALKHLIMIAKGESH